MNNITNDDTLNTKSDYIIFDFKTKRNFVDLNKNINNDFNESINITKNINSLLDYKSKKEINKNEEKEHSLNFSNIALSKRLKSINNNIDISQSNNRKTLLKLNIKKNVHMNNILKLKNFVENKNKIINKNFCKKNSLKSTGQQTNTTKNLKNNVNLWRNNSMNYIMSKNELAKTVETNNTNIINSFISKENNYEKTMNMPLLGKNKNKEISGRRMNKKNMNKRLSYLKKTKLTNKSKNISSSLVSIERFHIKRNNNMLNNDNFNKIGTKQYENNLFILNSNNLFSRNKKLVNKEKNIFSQILFSILNNNREKIENKFEFKLHKPSNINIFTLMELYKKKKIKSCDKV